MKKEIRPWGYWQMLYQGEGFWIKKITVNPIEALSLQTHSHRSEKWIVLNGSADVLVAGKRYILNKAETIFIPRLAEHRLMNNTQKPLEVLEIAYGNNLSENDIVRIEDNYGRDK